MASGTGRVAGWQGGGERQRRGEERDRWKRKDNGSGRKIRPIGGSIGKEKEREERDRERRE